MPQKLKPRVSPPASTRHARYRPIDVLHLDSQEIGVGPACSMCCCVFVSLHDHTSTLDDWISSEGVRVISKTAKDAKGQDGS